MSFERFVADNEREVLRLCTSILGDEHLGRDAAQETFLRLWRLGRRAPRDGAAWLHRVARRVSIDLLRKRHARDAADQRAWSRARDRCAPPAEKHAIESELNQRFDLALECLSAQQRTIFLLRHDAQLTLREIAEQLDLSSSSVKTQFARSCWKLQERLTDLEKEHRDD